VPVAEGVAPSFAGVGLGATGGAIEIPAGSVGSELPGMFIEGGAAAGTGLLGMLGWAGALVGGTFGCGISGTAGVGEMVSSGKAGSGVDGVEASETGDETTGGGGVAGAAGAEGVVPGVPIAGILISLAGGVVSIFAPDIQLGRLVGCCAGCGENVCDG
jgi:hypothetical protein